MFAQVLGRLISGIDALLRYIKPAKSRKGVGFESTGVHIAGHNFMPKVIKSGDVVFVDYDNDSHKLWRSQEFSIVQQNLKFFQKPVLDLGCGDGSFAKVLFDHIEYGVDPDTIALAVAGKLGLYHRLLNCLAENTGLPNSSIGTVFSNSVLEHTHNLNEIVKEVSRILQPGGTFIFTVPNDRFTTYMEKYFGAKETTRLNEEVFFHRNLFSNEQWKRLLIEHNLDVMLLQNYQFERFNYVFRILRSPYVKRINRLFKFWSNEWMIKMVKKSLSQNEGAGSFIIAKKR